ncbi:MAG: glycosyltransferase family 2 protein [Pseudomonadota bacterium]
MTKTPKISVLMPAYNCGAYLPQAVDSVVAQLFTDWELVIVDDGSSDDTRAALDRYRGDDRIVIHRQENQGLSRASQAALLSARGEYVIRLDADDWFDENILFVLNNVLDTHQDYAMVYTDYYRTNEEGELLEQVVLGKVNGDTVLDLPALNTGTMIRKSCLVELGGYNPDIRCQDNYDLWIRFIQKYKACNINLPLWYYRQRANSLTTLPGRIFTTRRHIKAEFVKRRFALPRVLAVVPVRHLNSISPDFPLMKLNGKRIIDHTLDEALAVEAIQKVVVSTDHPELMVYLRHHYPQVECLERSKGMAAANVGILPTVHDVLNRHGGHAYDAVALLHVHCPLRRAHHIKEAIDTLLIFQADSVVSVVEDRRVHYQRMENGLSPVHGNCETLRLERQCLFSENGAIFLSRPSCITENRLLGDRVGHVLMREDESVAIHDPYDFWLASRIIERNGHPRPEPGD